MGEQNKIIINNNELSFKSGETILEVAKRYNIDLPTLCHLKGSVPTGRCGICVVEIQGMDNLRAACATKAENSMIVFTESKAVVDTRKKVIKEFLSMGNHNCAVSRPSGNDWTHFQMKVQADDNSAELCPAWGDCRLQDLAYRYQVTGEKPAAPYQTDPMEIVNPFIIRDSSRCILCGKCVKACREIQVNDAIDFDNADAPKKIIAGDNKPLKDSECVFCGECIQACPVGALVEKDARFDRGWQEKKIKTTCTYCGVGCQIYLHVKDNIITRVTGVEGVAPNYGSLCVKGRFGFNFVSSPERLTKPLIKENGKLREAEWDEALDLVASKLSQIKKDHGPDSIGVLTSARMSNEDNYIAQKFARAVLKTNNIDHCARL